MPSVHKLSPVLVVDAVPPCVEFWQRLGFVRTVEVPHGDTVGFAILAKEGIEVMYQTAACVQDDHTTGASAFSVGGSCLFVEVSDLDAAIRATQGAPVVVPRRTTFYGMQEYGVKDPGGHVIVFAQKV